MPITDDVRARSSLDVKERAAAALADMGLSISDAIRLMMVGAGERWFPLEMNAPPGVITSSAAAEREGRRARALASIDDFMAELRNPGN
ncbi:MAG TPA: type II toxin-antitoxin system RelB/DinJ family antitoxin [Roseiarcus sp.]|jgi:DNA-damage-inducible protein J